MSAINFVVRDGAGNISRGSVAGEGGQSSLYVGAGSEVSLNLTQGQIISYTRSGQSLQVTLIDGRVITIDGYFGVEGVADTQLFLSADGYLSEVNLTQGAGEDYFANYIADDGVGKYALNDDLYFMRGSDVLLADASVADDDVGMLAGALGGIAAPLFGWGGAAAAATVAGAAVLTGGGDGSTPAPEVAVSEGTTDSNNHVVNEADHADGVEIVGTGTPGAQVDVTIDDVTETTTVAEDGSWGVVFAPEDVAEGEYTTDVIVTVTNGGGSTTVTDTLVVDTVIGVDLEASGGADGVINAVEFDGGVTLSGTVTGGESVVVTIAGADYDAVVVDGAWSLDVDSSVLGEGEYDAEVVVTATDAYGNSSSTTGTIVVDTVTSVTLDTSSVGGADGVVGAEDHSNGVTLTGTAQSGASVAVTFGTVTQTVVADADGNWTTTFLSGDVPTGELDVPVSVTATDAAGNTASASGTVEIDTITSVTLDTSSVGGADNIVSGGEQSGGVTLTGTAQPGASVAVTFGTVTQTVVAGADGTWSTTYAASDVPTGELEVPVSVTATDAAGNTASTTGSVDVDTITDVTVDTSTVGGSDTVVNGVEQPNGVTLTGTAQPGASVAVTFGTVTQTVVAGSDGTWATTYAASDVPTGELDVPVSVTATDAAGNTATATSSVAVDTLVNDLQLTSNSAGGSDGVVNFNESGEAISMAGTVEPGSTVTVELHGVSMPAAVDANGNWTVTFAGGTLPGGEYDTTVVVTATDAAGNSSSLSEAVTVDTVAGDLALSTDPIEIDDIVNETEHADGVIISGTATAGLTVTVGLGDASLNVVAGSDGTWSVNFPAGSIPEGTYDTPITASITDAAGNYKEVSDTVHIDTEVLPNEFSSASIEGDNIINGAEALDGVVLSGSVEAGSTIVAEFGGQSVTTVAGADGTWSVSFPASAIVAGEYNATYTATATDPAGNVSVITDTVQVDTLVNELTTSATVEGDDIVNGTEAADGVTLTGTVEAGSTVMVTFQHETGAITREATVDANGNWSVTYAAGEIPGGEYDANITIAATDANGNTDSITDTFAVDTIATDAAVVEFVGLGDEGVRSVEISGTDGNDYTLSTIDENGSVSHEATGGEGFNIGTGELFAFNPELSDGTHLVVNESDAAGNTNATYVVLEESGTDTVTLAGLDNFDVGSIDLSFATDSELTLDLSTLEGLSDNDNNLIIHGGSDDSVDLSGATNTGQSTSIDGKSYDLYTMGDDAQILIEEDINVTI